MHHAGHAAHLHARTGVMHLRALHLALHAHVARHTHAHMAHAHAHVAHTHAHVAHADAAGHNRAVAVAFHAEAIAVADVTAAMTVAIAPVAMRAIAVAPEVARRAEIAVAVVDLGGRFEV